MTVNAIFLVIAAAVIAPLLSLATRRLVPGVVFEILLGVLVGPAVLALARPLGLVDSLADLGIALLMFLAGLEVSLRDLRGDPLRRSGFSWLTSVVLAGAVGGVVALAGHPDAALVVAIALCTTALGTLVPILREREVLATPIGRSAMMVGTVGEFGPIVLIALLLGERNWVATLVFLAAFVAIVVLGIWAVRTWRMRWLRRAVVAGLHGPSQLPVRVAILAVVFFVLVADDFGIDGLLGAFCAGLVVRAAIGFDEEPGAVRTFEGKIEAVGFGLLVPIFFVVSGMRMDVASMLANPESFLVIPLIVLAFLICRSVPTYFAYRGLHGHDGAMRVGLLSGAALPLVVVVSQLGVTSGALEPQIGAAMVAGGLVSVLLLPVLALRRRPFGATDLTRTRPGVAA